MEQTFDPYIKHHAGDLITADNSNDLQVMIREDIAKQAKEAAESITHVESADNAAHLEDHTLQQIKDELKNEILAEIPKRTGYRRLFLKLKLHEEKVVHHDLKTCPLVDLYQLDYFRVGASEDGYQFETWVNFYLYQSGEKRLRFRDENLPDSPLRTVDIEPQDGHAYRIPFKDMLEMYSVDYSDDSSLNDLETEFWKAFFAAPNDEFDDDQYAHSPWFDRCCRENMSVSEIKRKRNWDDIWFQMRPRKTVNYPYLGGNPIDPANNTPVDNYGQPEAPIAAENINDGIPVMPAPTQIEVTHFDLNHLGLMLLRPAVYPPELFAPPNNPDGPGGIAEDRREQILSELKIMLLLKV
ncbi:MAG: hypothetical protein QNJ45_08605 [Ardenticatenaceae bacterium]|nr:hypothetical protein [Ardenticatenaceae bacterium]